jgi:hypothetical protein
MEARRERDGGLIPPRMQKAQEVLLYLTVVSLSPF